jgi:hypothetical protein
MPSEQTTSPELLIDGKSCSFDSSYALRWYDTSDGKSIPVLYKNGKRVVKRWSMDYSAYSPEDPDGGNANTN